MITTNLVLMTKLTNNPWQSPQNLFGPDVENYELTHIPFKVKDAITDHDHPHIYLIIAYGKSWTLDI